MTTGPLVANYIAFTKQPGLGVQTITGVGLRGKALFLWSTRQPGLGVSAGVSLLTAMTDGVVQVARYIDLPNAQTATTSAQAERTDCLIFMVSATSGATPAVEVRGVFTGWTDDGFTINWTNNDAAPTLFHALVIGGTALQVAMKQIKITVGLNQTIAVTGVGFQPDSFIVLGGAADEFGAGDYNLGAPFGSTHGFGFSNVTQNICSWALGRGTGGAPDSNTGLHTDRVASIRTANFGGAGELCSAVISATGPDGFTITRRDGNTGHQPVQHVLCLKGAEFSLGTFTTPSTPSDVPITFAFPPGVAMVQTHQSTTLNTVLSGLHLMMGAWAAGIGQGGTWIGGTASVSPSVYQRASYVDHLIQTRREDTLAVTCEAAIVATTPTSLTLHFTTVPTPAMTFIYLVLGAVTPVVPVTPPRCPNPILAFSGFGDAPMKFMTVDGVPIPAPVYAPKVGQAASGAANSGDPSDPNYDGHAGCQGVVALDDNTFCFTGTTYGPTYNYINYGTMNAAMELASLQGDPDGYMTWSIASGYEHNVFYALRTPSPGANYQIWKMNAAGHVIATFDCGFNRFPFVGGIGVASDDSAAYVGDRSTSTVWKCDMAGGFSTFVTGPGGSGVGARDNAILVLRNHDVLIAFNHAPDPVYVYHYNPSGVLLHQYPLPSGAGVTVITPALNDASFWLHFYGDADTSSGVTVMEIEIGTGAILHQFDPDDGDFEFDGPFCVICAPTVPIPPEPPQPPVLRSWRLYRLENKPRQEAS